LDKTEIELRSVREANDKNNNDKIKEIEKLKKKIEEMQEEIDTLKK
jgi:hypothetical protein